jgi:urease subunit beta
MRPGEVIPGEGPVPAAQFARRSTLTIRNTGRFPAFVGSHFPVSHASGALEFPREGLYGARLTIPAGASVRIDPGEAVEVEVGWA